MLGSFSDRYTFAKVECWEFTCSNSSVVQGRWLKKTAACPSFSEAGFLDVQKARETSWVQWEPPTKSSMTLAEQTSGKGILSPTFWQLNQWTSAFGNHGCTLKNSLWPFHQKNKNTGQGEGLFVRSFMVGDFFMPPPALKPTGRLDI